MARTTDQEPSLQRCLEATSNSKSRLFRDLHPHNFPTIIGAGFELWMVNKELGFNNILISTDEAVVHKWNKDHFTPKHTAQEEKTKKEEKKEKASEKAESFTGALTDFVSTIKDAWTNLYSENQIATVAITAIGGLIPVVLMIVICCRKPAPKAKPAAEKKPKAEEKKEEKKPKVEEVKEETKEAENKPESESESDSSSSSEDEKKEEEKPKVQSAIQNVKKENSMDSNKQ